MWGITITELSIHLKTGVILTFTVGIGKTDAVEAPWQEFIDWFGTGSTDTSVYTERFKDGSTGILKSSIDYYNIRKKEV